ncbi:Predicted arabinose efflux permease, MFS family [Gordonia malaquae]|uniref:Putative major facilitator superfamily transporter n=1 Tax=Gordonia malaquae NBRC 108250 TaxID=1223542 RepID=M3VDJ8_GORML|nr:MFS transporter [Gordonia malaquae]GAC78539.1 putative major facilitator superfamily transporter [Gordonia malaquae NBRC 108250]SED44104.1 Predicted arabinose efflux permease, MFS family [Gordonia malaquae]
MTECISPVLPPATPPATTPRRSWASVAVIAAGTFLVVTAEMLPIGVLTPMSSDLATSSAAIGLAVTVTGLVAAVVAPVVPHLLGALDRRMVLAAALVMLGVGDVMTGVADSLPVLLVSRLLVGLGMATVWGMASALAARLVPGRRGPLAVSIVIGGVAAASVLGVPLGTLVGSVFGWRAAFIGLGVATVGVGAVALRVMPEMRRPPEVESPTGGVRLRLLRPSVMVGAITVALVVTAHFAAYTYVRPLLEDRSGFSAVGVTVALLVYGVGGLIGNFVAGAVASKSPRSCMATLGVGIAVAVVVLATLGTAPAAAMVGLVLWGVAYGGVSVTGQLWMTTAAPDRVEQVTGLYAGVFNASIALGAFLGGRVVGVGHAPLLWLAAGIAVAAAGVALTPTR